MANFESVYKALMKILFFLQFVAISGLGQNGFSIKIPHYYDLGLIAYDSLGRGSVGTGFLISPTSVMTCAHVSDGKPYIYYIPANSKRSFKIFIEKNQFGHDLAVYKSKEIICNRYLKLAKRFHPNLGDSILYIGWDTKPVAFEANLGVITSFGKLI